jgi:hypothetical protein
MGRSQGQRRKAAAMLLSGQNSFGRDSGLVKMKPVTGQGSIEALGYDQKRSRLYISFKSKHPKKGQGYYEDVSKEVYQEMTKSKNLGRFQQDNLSKNYRWYFSDKKDLDL